MPYGEIDTVEVVRPRPRGWRTAAVGALIALGFAVVFAGSVAGLAAILQSDGLLAILIGPLVAAAIAVAVLVVARWRLGSFTVGVSALVLLAANAAGLMLASAGDVMLPVLLDVSYTLAHPSTTSESAGAAGIIALMVVVWLGSVALWTVGLFSAIRRTAAATPRPWLWPMLTGIAMAILQSAALTAALAVTSAVAQ